MRLTPRQRAWMLVAAAASPLPAYAVLFVENAHQQVAGQLLLASVAVCWAAGAVALLEKGKDQAHALAAGALLLLGLLDLAFGLAMCWGAALGGEPCAPFLA